MELAALIGPLSELFGEVAGFGRDIFGQISGRRNAILDTNEKVQNTTAQNAMLKQAAIAVAVLAVIVLVYKSYKR